MISKKAIEKFVTYRPNQITFFTFLISLVITQGIALRTFIVERDNEFLQVEQEAKHIKNQLESSLNHSVNATKMLAFLVEKDLAEKYFETISRKLLAQSKYIDAVQLVKDKRIIKTYPLKGNEATIGYSIMSDSLHRREAMKAIARKELYFEGPITLKQGGIGIVGRLPIYRQGEFWGFSAVIIRIQTVFNAIGVDSTGSNETYIYQLAKRQATAGEQNHFFADQKDYDKDVFFRAYVPSGDWDVYVRLKEPAYISNATQFSLLGLVFSFLLSLFTWYLAKQPQKLKIHVEEKTKDLDELNKVLEERAQELIASNRELEQFAYVASHDLQEPLRMVTNFLSQLEKKYSAALDEKGRQYIYFAVNGAQRMRAIILDILEFSKVGKYEGKLENIDVNKVIDELCLIQQKVIEEKNATITYADLPKITFYLSPLQQVFQNLIVNALKYSKSNESPRVSIIAKDLGEKWQFSVRDNGIGIAQEYLDKIFVIFQRLHTTEQYSGTGVGLAIVKKIIENFGGAVWVESEVGVGTVFHFTLPKQPYHT